jgi:hypothetical protein
VIIDTSTLRMTRDWPMCRPVAARESRFEDAGGLKRVGREAPQKNDLTKSTCGLLQDVGAAQGYRLDLSKDILAFGP